MNNSSLENGWESVLEKHKHTGIAAEEFLKHVFSVSGEEWDDLKDRTNRAAVHRSQEFRDWMKEHHKNIIVMFVPGGCTGVFQACDVGMQRMFKHACKRAYHEDIVKNMLKKLDAGEDVLTIDKAIKTVRDGSVRWLWNAYTSLNDPKIVKKVSDI